MSLFRDLAKKVSSRAERDVVEEALRIRFEKAMEGSDFVLPREVKEKAIREAGLPEWLELWEVEDRGVATAWPPEGMGWAWVWRDGAWYYAPGLVNKSWLEGRPLSREYFALEFPGADIEEAERLARRALAGDVPSL